MKKLVLPLLATTLAVVLALLVLSPAQNAEARNTQPHEDDPSNPGVLCWGAHLGVDRNGDAVPDLGWNVGVGQNPDACTYALQQMTSIAESNGWTIYTKSCFSYTESPECTIDNIN